MRKFLSLVPLAVATAACASGNANEAEVQPSGVQGNRSFAASGFDKVALRGPDKVIVRVGPAASVSAAGDTAVLDQLEIEVVDGTLRVDRKDREGGNGFGWRSREGSATVTVTLPVLTAASVAGSGDMEVDRAEATSFDASIAGSGNLSIGSLTAEAADISIAGSGDASVAGQARRIDIAIAGSGNVDASGLKSERADISIAGSGNARAGVDGEAEISIMGSGDVEITGNATCDVSKLGSGDVRCGSGG